LRATIKTQESSYGVNGKKGSFMKKHSLIYEKNEETKKEGDSPEPYNQQFFREKNQKGKVKMPTFLRGNLR